MSPLDGWTGNLASHHRDLKQLELSVARQMAKDYRIGWYVAPSYTDWQIGKMTLTNPFQRYRIVRDDGSPLIFPSVENALEFFRKELGVFGVAMFAS
jgi:hypothetical protein